MHWLRTIYICLVLLFACRGVAGLDLDVISYADFVQEDPEALKTLEWALYQKGIVGIRGIPEYREKVAKFIEAARLFSSLPEEIKETYAPNRERGDLFLGYEKGKEKFKRDDGTWVVDDLKISYYAYVPAHPQNIWPSEVDLATPYLEIGSLMVKVGEEVMSKVGLVGPETGIEVAGLPAVGRMLYYSKSDQTHIDNPLWCGAHFDHGIFTVLLPAIYFFEGQVVDETEEAGLFVRTMSDGKFQKIAANDPDVMMFQVGEFGQIVKNDSIRATEHRVHKPLVPMERYTMALFFDAPMDLPIYSTSELKKDARYGDPEGPCTYRRWHEESFKRYSVK